MAGNLARHLNRVAFQPELLPPDAITAVALVPPVLAGLLLFHLPALEALAIALVVGGFFHFTARLIRLPLVTSPVLPAVVGVALCGAATPLVLALAIAALVGVLEVLRGRLFPALRVQTGVLAYSILFLASGGAMAIYLRPGGVNPFPEPIHQWAAFYGGSAHFIEPSTLYVGNLAGPMLATSLLAVAISLAWLWYARRLNLSVLAGFLIGAVAISTWYGWDPLFQLDSGPAWFVVGLALADRAWAPLTAVGRPFSGVVAGLLGVGLRAGHLYVEGLFLTVALVQLVIALVETLVRLVSRSLRSSRLPDQREPVSA